MPADYFDDAFALYENGMGIGTGSRNKRRISILSVLMQDYGRSNVLSVESTDYAGYKEQMEILAVSGRELLGTTSKTGNKGVVVYAVCVPYDAD